MRLICHSFVMQPGGRTGGFRAFCSLIARINPGATAMGGLRVYGTHASRTHCADASRRSRGGICPDAGVRGAMSAALYRAQRPLLFCCFSGICDLPEYGCRTGTHRGCTGPAELQCCLRLGILLNGDPEKKRYVGFTPAWR